MASSGKSGRLAGRRELLSGRWKPAWSAMIACMVAGSDAAISGMRPIIHYGLVEFTLFATD